MNTYYYMNVYTGDIDTLEGWEERGAMLGGGRFIPVRLDISNPDQIHWYDDTNNIIGWEDRSILHYRVFSQKLKEYIPIIHVEEERKQLH